jgi:hypothetical protein
MEEEEFRLSEFLSIQKNVFLLLMSLVSDKRSYFEQLIKFTPVLRYNTKLVMLEKDDNSNVIGYDELKGKNETMNNTYFVIFDFNVLVHYDADIINDNNSNNNKFIIMLDINEIKNYIRNKSSITNIVALFGKNFDLTINTEITSRKSYISDEQLRLYNQEYLKYEKSNSLERVDNTEPSKLLNIYFDNKITSLDNINLDKALQRAPKFKTILLDILLKNKKRHLIKMIDGKYGIDSFLTIYNKIKDTPVLILIKKSDNFSSKVRKLQSFNESNAPGVLLTDFHFSKDMMPKNIDYFHITDGGINYEDDLITLFDQCNARNYSGSYPRKIELISHIAVAFGSVVTLDAENYKELFNQFNKSLELYEVFKKNSTKIYLKGDEFYIQIKK